ncbi:TPA: hypothetical protein EYP13_00345, partial [Candidatus Micrarchaeota archaeon]|nr:hypothetical protein [Candidatus Micrarchaeota archaeon]
MDPFLTVILSFLYGIGTAVALPTPTEAVLIATRYAPGWAVICAAVFGKSLGAFLIYRFAVYIKGLDRVERWKARNRYAQVLFRFGERWVDRFGPSALFFLLLIPGFPDTGAVYLTAVAGGRPLAFALAVGASSAVRLSLAYL